MSFLYTRSPYRKLAYSIPSITISYSDFESFKHKGNAYQLASLHLRPWTYCNVYDQEFYSNKMFPSDQILHCNRDEKVNSSAVRYEIEKVIKKIFRSKKRCSLSNAHILKDSDFNYRSSAGLVVVKLKQYPFILKIYRETPQTFCSPCSKGLVPTFVFRTGNGATRHLSGLTRIPMRDVLENLLENMPAWKDRIVLPRKWLWLPDDLRWLYISGDSDLFSFNAWIPSVYVIVCDSIEIERSLSFLNEADRTLAIQIGQIFDNKIDSNIPNFVIQKGTGKIAIIDTEYFPLMLSLKNSFKAESYSNWLFQLAQMSAKKIVYLDKKTLQKECVEYHKFNVYSEFENFDKR